MLQLSKATDHFKHLCQEYESRGNVHQPSSPECSHRHSHQKEKQAPKTTTAEIEPELTLSTLSLPWSFSRISFLHIKLRFTSWQFYNNHRSQWGSLMWIIPNGFGSSCNFDLKSWTKSLKSKHCFSSPALITLPQCLSTWVHKTVTLHWELLSLKFIHQETDLSG